VSVKIHKLQIRNFKTFRDVSLDFGSSVLTVLDGPNGFGKTSFYDAIELLLTGRIRRYDNLVDLQVNKRRKDLGCPFLFEGAGAAGDLVIKGEVVVDNQTLVLMRKGSRVELEAIKGFSTNAFPLYELPQFDDESEAKLVPDEEKFISCLLGDNFKKNFGFLNYIEQEENTYLLKSTDEKRKAGVAHLFNTSEFRARTAQIENAKKDVATLCNTKAKRRRDDLEASIKQLESIIVTFDPVPYLRLIESKDHPWDIEELKFSSNQFAEWLGEDGLLEQITQLVFNQTDFLADRFNNRVQKSLWPKDEAVDPLLRYGRFVDEQSVYKVCFDADEAMKGLITLFSGNILEFIRQDKLLIPSILTDLISEHFDVEKFGRVVSRIKTLDAESTTLASALAGLRSSRQDFLSKFKLYTHVSTPSAECPTCGYDWKLAQELSDGIVAQTKKLEELTKTIGIDIDKLLVDLRSDFLTKIITFLESYREEHPVDAVYLESLIKLSEKQVHYLNTLKSEYAAEGIDLDQFYISTPSSEENPRIDDLRAAVNARKKSVDIEKIKPFFRDLFLNVFGGDEVVLNNCTEELIKSKRVYLHWKYSIQQNSELEKKRVEYDKLCSQIKSANTLKANLNDLQKVYEQACQEYERDIIHGIEILFHLYSGRIVQDCQGGRGLFIKSDTNGIRFLENPRRIHDAVFSMSSGQLAALVISFTLALNKRYSTDKLLFIDDPIQTLDELNVVGLIDVLRNEFHDRQIFISTHEDQMSAYIRYKFLKYGLPIKRLNFKEIQFGQNYNESI